MFSAPYLTYILTSVALFAIMAASFNLLLGYTGLINLGHSGLFLIGAYTTVLLHIKLGVPLWIGTLSAMIASAAAGGFLSILTRRSKGDAVGVMTLWFLIALMTIALNWNALTRGALGIAGIARPALFTSPEIFFLLTAALCAIVYAFLWKVMRSPFGRVLGAVRDDELACATLGKNVFKIRVIAFMLAGALAGLGGTLFAFLYRFIDPPSFYITQLTTILTIVCVGGLATLTGTFLGAALIIILPEALRFLPLNPEILGAIRQILFSALILIVVLARPKGILGKVKL